MEFQVFFEDFGTCEDLKIQEVVPIGKYEKQPPPFAQKIRLNESLDPEKLHLQVDDHINVKTMSIDPSGVAVVDVKIDSVPVPIVPPEVATEQVSYQNIFL